MFNARPTSLLGLEPRQGAGQHEWVNHLTPMLTSPDDLFKYYERFNEFINATTPTSLSAIELSGQFQSQLQQSAQQYMPEHNHIPNCPQHLQQPAQQQQVPPQQHQPPPPPPPPPSTQPQPQQQPQQQPQLQQPQLQPQLQQLQQQQQQHQQQPQLPVQPQYPQQQLEEEKLRNKRERNRKAAANCRRRKDEKLKKLEEENSELRKIIETLKASISALRMGCETKMES